MRKTLHLTLDFFKKNIKEIFVLLDNIKLLQKTIHHIHENSYLLLDKTKKMQIVKLFYALSYISLYNY